MLYVDAVVLWSCLLVLLLFLPFVLQIFETRISCDVVATPFNSEIHLEFWNVSGGDCFVDECLFEKVVDEWGQVDDVRHSGRL